MNDSGDGWASITVNGKVDGIQFVCADPSPVGTVFNCWEPAIANLNLTEAYFNTDDRKWYKEKACINEVKMLDVAYEVYLTGSGEKFGDGDLDKAIKLDSEGYVFKTTIKHVPAGSYTYQFVQSKNEYGRTYTWGGTVDALTAGGENLSITLTESSNITFSFFVESVKDNNEYNRFQITAAALGIAVEASGATAQEVIDAINAIGTVTLDSKNAIEAAEALYASADAEEKGKVTNYSTLTAARKAYDKLKADQPTTAANTGVTAAPQTGDTFPLAIIFLCLLGCVATSVVLIVARRKSED